MLIRNTWLGGQQVDIFTNGDRIASVQPHRPETGSGDVEGGLVCPHFAEPHVHLDATQLGARKPNRSGTLNEGIDNWATLRDKLDAEDVRQRALKTLQWYAAHGTTRVRTHVDTASRTAAETLLNLRNELMDSALLGVPIQLQVVAFPQQGILTEARRLREWRAVVDMGCDAVGCIPHYEASHAEGDRSVELCFEVAERHNIGVDVHCDETDDPSWKALVRICAETQKRNYGGRVVAGHCTAMHSWPDELAEQTIQQVALSGVQIVTNPLDNIVLQGRGDRYPKRRGLTRVDELWAAGAIVGIGHDSVVDPWYRLGTANMLDPAHMLIHAGHLTSEADMQRVFATLHGANHLPFGAPPTIAEGEPANLLWFDAGDPVEVIRRRQRPQVIAAGRLVDFDGVNFRC